MTAVVAIDVLGRCTIDPDGEAIGRAYPWTKPVFVAVDTRRCLVDQYMALLRTDLLGSVLGPKVQRERSKICNIVGIQWNSAYSFAPGDGRQCHRVRVFR